MTYNQIDRLRAILRPLSQEALVLLAVELVRALGEARAEAFIAKLEQPKDAA